MKTDECRLCNGTLEFRFQKSVLGKHAVNYFQCSLCESLQTEPPYWLKEAYSGTVPNFDTGAVRRTTYNLAAVFFSTKLLGVKNWLDFGGGPGLLARLLRDHGVEAHSFDKYEKDHMTRGLKSATLEYEGLCAFEVLEHLENPRDDLSSCLQASIKFALFSTVRYEGQGPEWWYLSPENGQHIFFYTDTALEQLAREYGFYATFFGNYILFYRELSFTQKLMLRMTLSKVFLHLGRLWLFAKLARGAERDLELLRDRYPGEIY